MKTTFLVNAFFLMAVCLSCQKDVPPAPVARFEINQMSVDRTGATYSFINSSQNATRYSWSFGDGGSSNQMTPVYKFKQNGLYEVRLTAEGDGGTDTFKQSIRVSNIPTTGDFIFWSRATKGTISIQVSGVNVGTITVYQVSPGVPECKTPGFVTVSLPEGVYTFTAKVQGTGEDVIWSSTITVINGLCGNIELRRA